MNKVNKDKLEEYRGLQYDWNNNGAEPFNLTLLNTVEDILNNIVVEPEMFPTACDSIQLEFDYKGKYLEFEIFINRVEYYYEYQNEHKEESLPIDINLINEKILLFFSE